VRAIVIAFIVAGCGAPQHGSRCKTVEKKTPRGLESWCEDAQGRRSGVYERRIQNIVVERGTYTLGALDGPYASFYADGARHSEGSYRSGARHGLWRVWHENGKPWLEAEYSGGVPHGLWRESSYTGVRAFEGTFRDGALEGAWRSYLDDGDVRASGASVHGKLEGLVEKRVGGGMRSLTPYRANRMHGTVKVFDRDGKELQNLEFADGIQVKRDAP
jgi:antitoxin component YwqK of YwqJK toxin-antitoxin module